ncbi:MAG: thioesterase [Alphaproteobacteria bacterium]|nr:thioesterase [Alphaproteobacteria bacterium]
MRELWRGNANAWECDELGHMNVQFYLAKASEAVAHLARLAGLGGVFNSNTHATLVARQIHIKFLAEARPGAPLFIHGGFTRYAASSAELTLVMRHGFSQQIAATFRLELDHVSPHEGRPFDWPKRFTERYQSLAIDAVAEALPRGITETASDQQISLERADELGLEQIGMGCFSTAEMGPFGRIRSDVLLGRVSNSVINFQTGFPEQAEYHLGRTQTRIGGALLETRILPRHWPRAGDAYVIRSGLRAVGPKVRNLVHWVLDPQTGRPWWTSEGVAAPMDLDARKLHQPGEKMQARLEAAVKPELRP